MNYEALYARLVHHARNRPLPEVVERHHVHPRCLGGTDDEGNIVTFTPREHFLAHRFLVRIHPLSLKLAYAVARMSDYARYNSRSYAKAREQYRRLNSQPNVIRHGPISAARTSQKLRDANLGKRYSPEVNASKGRPGVPQGKRTNPETLARLSRAAKGRKAWNKGLASDMAGKSYDELFGTEKAEAIKAKQRAAANARPPMSEEVKARIRASVLRRNKEAA